MLLKTIIDQTEKGRVPDFFIRKAAKLLSSQRIRQESRQNKLEYINKIKNSPLAIATDDANAQHYELPPEFFDLCLGKRKKYSACHWEADTTTLDVAEENALELFCKQAQIKNGQKILELGCGWGSLTLWLAEKYPQCKITAVSNSAPQRVSIEKSLKEKNLDNVTVLTKDINDLNLKEEFDRVLSIEMFEHVRNYKLLFKNISQWLKPDGILYFHVFLHKTLPYVFETSGEDNWMGRYFFAGGQMPSFDLFEHFQDDLKLKQKWYFSGTHYEKTSNAWLALMDQNKMEIMKILETHYGKDAAVWFQRWRMFYLAVAEFFGYAEGQEWGVGHFMMSRT